MMQELERRINESYEHIRLYLNQEECTKELREMCKNCEKYCGEQHDYEECKDRPCFRFWLCYEYVDRSIAFGG